MALVRRQFLTLAGATLATSIVPEIGAAQTYPARPVRMIVPYAAGGPTDVTGRLIAQKLSDRLGQRFYVENIGGAGSNIGMGRAARAAPDGYTILVAFFGYVVNPTLYETVPYDPYRSFDPVTLATSTTILLAVNPSVPAQTVKELAALIQNNPEKYSYASGGGFGSPGHLVGEQFRMLLGLNLPHVPFNGATLAVEATLGGHISIAFVAPTPAIPFVRKGKLRALAVMSKTRLQALPDVPTMVEAGYPQIECESWFGIVVPAGTPKEIITLLNREIVRVITLPETKEYLASFGLDGIGSTPDEFAQIIRADVEKWSKVIRSANLKVQ